MPRYDDLNIRAIVVVGLITTAFVLAIVIGLQALYFSYERSLSDRRAPTATVESANLTAEQEARLQRKGWIDRQKGVVAIPIDRAMEIVTDELRRKQIGDGP